MGRNVGGSWCTSSRPRRHSQRRMREPGANLAATAAYLRKLEGEEDSGWRKVAALLE